MFQYVTEDGEPKYIEYPEPSYLIWFIKNHHTVWYNASYDLGTITHQAGEDVGTAIEMDDLFFAARTAYPELEKYSLDILHDKLGMQYYDQDLDKKKMQKSFTYAEAKRTRKATDDQIQYALSDVLTLRYLWKQKAIQKVIKKNKAYKLDIKSLKYSVIYQRNGIPVDREALAKERTDLVERIADNRETLGDLNPRSPKRVCEALGTPKSDKDTLVRLMSEGNELAKVIYEQRRLLKADKMLESWDFDRVHTFFNPAGTITGRFNASGGDVGMGYVNTQQISRQYQYLFKPKKESDTVVIDVDLSTAELRAGCSIMNDKTMAKEISKGKDLHIEAAKLTGIKNPTREDRQRGKAVSFGLIFSMSAKSFKEYAFVNYGVTFSRREAIAIHRAYHRKYKGISDYQSGCWDTYDTVPKESAMGRRNMCRLGTDASNYATQSSIAEVTKWAVHYLITEYPESIHMIVNTVHDCIQMEVHKDDAELWMKRLDVVFKKGWDTILESKIMKIKGIPMETEGEIR